MFLPPVFLFPFAAAYSIRLQHHVRKTKCIRSLKLLEENLLSLLKSSAETYHTTSHTEAGYEQLLAAGRPYKQWFYPGNGSEEASWHRYDHKQSGYLYSQ